MSGRCATCRKPLPHKGYTWTGQAPFYCSSDCQRATPSDNIEHPSHYKQLPVEVIEITKHFDFLLGNVLKYVLRHEHKGKPLEDLKKARWYLDRAITEREGGL